MEFACAKGIGTNLAGGGDIGRTAQLLREHPDLLVSFSIYRLVSLYLLTGVFLASGSLHIGGASSVTDLPRIAFVLFACMAVFLFLASIADRLAPTGRHRIGYPAAVILAAGIALLHLNPDRFVAAPLGDGLFIAGAILASLGYCIVHIEFGRIMGMLGTSRTLIFTIASYLVGGGACAVLSLLPSPADLALMLVLLAAMAALLEHDKDRLGREELFRPRSPKLLIPWKFILTSLIQGVSVGLAYILFTHAGAPDIVLQTAATLIACAAAFTTVIAMRINYDRLIYRIGFLAMGLGILLYSFMGLSAQGTIVANFVQLAAFAYLDMVLWSFGAYLIKHLNQSAIWSTCCPTSALMGGRFLGTVMGAFLMGFDAEATTSPFGSMPAIAGVIAFVIVAAALLLSSTQNVRSGWGFVRPGDPEESEADNVRLSCEMIAEDYGLTAREAEILHLLAEGKARQAIADGLFVSQNTVKTHVRSIYGKLNVHSREELSALIEARGRAFEPTAQ